jgi:hypothetical protein
MRTIVADSVVPTAPVTTLSQLLTGRATGVQTLTRDGQVGAGTVAYIQGLSGAASYSEPLVYIDGVRVNGTAGGDNPAAGGHPGTSRLDDLDPAEIARVDVLSGAEAMPTYGPGAANGVIAITTKRGPPGGPHWDVLAEGGVSTTPLRGESNYYAWGHAAGDTIVQCPRYAFAAGQCAIDSVTNYNVLTASATSPFGTGYHQRYVVSARGSVPGNVLRYFVSGNYADETGTLELPASERTYYQSVYQVGAPPSVVRPNAMDASGVRGAATADVGHVADVSASVGYLGNHQRSAPGGQLLESGAVAYGIPPTANSTPWLGFERPANLFPDHGLEGVQRFTAGTQANWRPFSIVHAFATVGVDATDQTSHDLSTASYNPPSPGPYFLTTDRQRTTRSTVDGGVTVTPDVGPLVRTTTTIGAQYLEDHFTERLDSTTGFSAAYEYFYEVLGTIKTRTGSGYIEETATIADRLTVGGDLRVDHMENSDLDDHATAVNAALRGSWRPLLLADSALRVHAAYATSSAFPTAAQTAALFQEFLAIGPIPVLGGPGPVNFASAPQIRPVPTREQDAELGVGAALLAGRLSADISVYDRRTIRAAVPEEGIPVTDLVLPLNSGVVQNRGIEANVSARLIDRPSLGWNGSLTVYGNQNRLEKELYAPNVTNALVQSVVGYPIYGLWSPPLKYADLNNNGIIEPNEILSTPNSRNAFQGSAVPTRQAALSTGVTLFHGRLRLATLVDYRGGYALPDASGELRAQFLGSEALNAPASLESQARSMSALLYGSYSGWIQQVNALRWRELSATVAAQRRVDVTVAVRNLALWTNYRGNDPDMDLTVDNGANAEIPQIPQPRLWTLRVHVAM